MALLEIQGSCIGPETQQTEDQYRKSFDLNKKFTVKDTEIHICTCLFVVSVDVVSTLM